MRNAEFDREKVLRSAMATFMDKGYAKTSMQDLKQVTGLHPGSIYCAFENKRGLLLAALEQYRLDRSSEFAAFFQDERPKLQQLKSYLDDLVEQCLRCDGHSACLLTKALSELALHDAEIQQVISQSLTHWQAAMAQVLAQAQQQGELATHKDALALARYLAMGIYGLRTYGHTQPEPAVLQNLADQLFEHICN